MVWEVSHDYIEGTGNPILDSIAVVLRNGSTDAIPYARKVRSTSQHRQQNATGKQVDALGKSVKGKPKFIRIFEP
jgi:chitinase